MDDACWTLPATALLAAGVAVLIGWPMVTSAVLHPLDALVRAAALIGSGDLAARPIMGHRASYEVRALGAAVGRMAVTLQARGHRIAAISRRLQSARVCIAC